MVHPFARKIVPLLNFLIASTALGFQVCVLYPWHHQLEEKFYQLQGEQKSQLEEYHRMKMQTIKSIEDNLNKLNTLKDQTKSK